jgi:hypothetical protein
VLKGTSTAVQIFYSRLRYLLLRYFDIQCGGKGPKIWETFYYQAEIFYCQAEILCY